jgi:hypothetical protein
MRHENHFQEEAIMVAQKAFLFILGATLCSSLAHAGWTSGGGELIRDAYNPWFLQNTKKVDYCVEVDEVNFGLPKARIQTIVKAALNSWKVDFAGTIQRLDGAQISTQTFTEVPCSTNVDVRFQFGLLSGEQISNLGDISQIIGIAVRTDYDRVNLRGRGFVYVASPRGPLKYEGKGLTDRPWEFSNGGLLYAILLHETSHLFGMRHRISGVDPNDIILLGERFAEQALAEGAAQGMAISFADLKPYLENSRARSFTSSACFVGGPRKTEPVFLFYGLPMAKSCFSTELISGKLHVWSSGEGEKEKTLIGTADMKTYGPTFSQQIVSIILTDEQKVFPPGRNVYGPAADTGAMLKGIYRTLDGKIVREIGINFQGYRRVIGAMDGTLLLDVNMSH